jgi:hypothetical protein
MVSVTSGNLSAGRAHLRTIQPHQYCCTRCGYGIVVRALPPECPMCRGTVWEAGRRLPAPAPSM